MPAKTHPLQKILYGLALIVALFTGFGNMPLYGRYYIADVPGFGWSGDFFINVNVHILAGSLLLAIAVYAFMNSILHGEGRKQRLTFTGRLRVFFLVLSLLTGILMVIKNLPEIRFPLEMLIAFNFAHMGAAVLLLIVSLLALILQRPWKNNRYALRNRR
jgi:uncharacterized membrane protein YhaH (DUF805 family)